MPKRIRTHNRVAHVAGIAICLLLSDPAFAGRLVAWGGNYYGQCDVPTDHDYAVIAAGDRHNLAIRSDGSLVGWGNNSYGQSDPPDGNDYTALAISTSCSIVLKSEGSIVAWGFPQFGVSRAPAGNDFVAIAGGLDHALALKSDGSLVAWGTNDAGQCNVPAGNDFTEIAAACMYSMALRSDGSIVAWGLGEDDDPPPFPGIELPPTRNVPSGHDFVSIAAGHDHALALKSNGSIIAWGRNTYGQCEAPAGNDFIAVAAGYFHSLALRSDGTVLAWGRNDDGRCDVPPLAGVTAISAGAVHSIALIGTPVEGEPTADAGPDIVARANQEVTLDGSRSNDSDGQIIEYTWKRQPDDTVIYSGPQATCTTKALGRAEELIELTVTDDNFIKATDTVVIVNQILYRVLEKTEGAQLGDLNFDRNINIVDLAILASNWLR